ncbi:MAG: hypothetical protein J5I59_05130 [Saprospiraceae bacterium]|nr:hypothetical protein [Saprospiraceae bacterium]
MNFSTARLGKNPGVIFLLFFLISHTMACKNNVKNVNFSDKPILYSTELQNDTIQESTFDKKNEAIPVYVNKTLTYIRIHDKAPDGFVGGRRFQNREGRLPKYDFKGRKIYYREWDVHPKRRGKNRGPERLITSQSKAYYTKDHYKTFITIKETYLN